MRHVIRSVFIASAIMLCATAPATASRINYAWTGTITFLDLTDAPPIPPAPPLALGQKIGITLSLDNAVPDSAPSPTRGFFDSQQPPPPSKPSLVLSVNFGGYDLSDGTWIQHGTVFADDRGVDVFRIQCFSQLQSSSFLISFRTSHPGVLSSDALPLSIDPKDFEATAFAVNTFYMSEVGPHFNGSIDSVVAPTPLPGSVDFFASALVGLLGLGRWQRRHSQAGPCLSKSLLQASAPADQTPAKYNT